MSEQYFETIETKSIRAFFQDYFLPVPVDYNTSKQNSVHIMKLSSQNKQM